MKTILLTVALALLAATPPARAAAAAATAPQTLDEIRSAAREQVVRELGLKGRKRAEFERLYDAYRTALEAAVDPQAASGSGGDEAARLHALKARLENIAATARVKREYVDRFSALLTAEQIRTLYNTEGQIGTSIKRADGLRKSPPRLLRGSGRRTTQDLGPAGAYTSIEAGNMIHVTVSPAAHTVTVTTDDNVADFVEMVREGTALAFRLRVRNIDKVRVDIVVPASQALDRIVAANFARVRSEMPLRADSVTIDISSYGSVEADIVSKGDVDLRVAVYGRFRGNIACRSAALAIQSYGKLEGSVACTGRCRAGVGSYGTVRGDLSAADLDLKVSSGGSVEGASDARNMVLSVASYAAYEGAIRARELQLTVHSSGRVGGAFEGDRIRAHIASYGKADLRGAAPVASATVTVASNGHFKAPDLRVADYWLTAASYANADIWCSGVLRIAADGAARVDYGGPCRVEAQPGGNIRRR